MSTDVTTLPSVDLRELNAEIKALMGRYDVSQTAVAELLGIKQPGVSARLRGVVDWKANELFVLAEAFGVHPAVLFGGRGPSPDDGGASAPRADDETRTRNILLGTTTVRRLRAVAEPAAA